MAGLSARPAACRAPLRSRYFDVPTDTGRRLCQGHIDYDANVTPARRSALPGPPKPTKTASKELLQNVIETTKVAEQITGAESMPVRFTPAEQVGATA